MQYSLEHGQVVFCPSKDTLQTLDGSLVKLRHLEKLLLQALLQQVSDKREIIQYVWPKTVVSDGSYHKLVFDLRKQLSQVGVDPTLIKTIPRRGLSYNGQWSEKPVPTEEALALSDLKPNSTPHAPREDIAFPFWESNKTSKNETVNTIGLIKGCENVVKNKLKFLAARMFRPSPSVSLAYFLCGTISLGSSLVLVF